MISSVSPLLNILAPKASAPVAGDPAAFDLMLAGASGATVGRQIAASTGKAVPPVAEILSPAIGAPILSSDDEVADAPPPVPTVPVTLAAVSPKAVVATPKPTAWRRFAEPETCADPTGELPITYGQIEEANSTSPSRAMPAFERDELVATERTVEPAGREQVASSDQPQASDLTSPAVVIPALPVTATLSRADASDRDMPIDRPVEDGSNSLSQGAAPTAASVQEPSTPVPVPVASGGSSTSAIVDERSSPLPPLAAPMPAHTPAARPVRAQAANLIDETEVASPTITPSTHKPAPLLAAAAMNSLPGQVTVVPPAPSFARRPSDAALPLVAAPPFAGSPFRPLPDITLPIVQPVAPAASAAPAMIASANSVVSQPAALPSTTAPVERTLETATPSVEPRSEAAKAPAPDRLPAAPIMSAVPTPAIARAVTSGPARQVFAADLRRTGRDLRPVVGETFMTPLETTGVGTTASVVAPLAAPLDLRQDRWPSAMVERIERLRDAVDAADTRIRLVPDALGAIEVAVTRDGDTVHVHFTAEQAATRALLQDAAPRLAEAAEARGLKLGQTAVGDGGSQQGGRQPRSQADPVPARPRSATAADEASPDTRIA